MTGVSRGFSPHSSGYELLRPVREVGEPPDRRVAAADEAPGVPQPDRSRSPSDARHRARGRRATHAIMRKVNSTFITPFDREDIYRLASNLDDVMDLMEAAVDLIVLYRIGELPAGITAQVEVLGRMPS